MKTKLSPRVWTLLLMLCLGALSFAWPSVRGKVAQLFSPGVVPVAAKLATPAAPVAARVLSKITTANGSSLTVTAVSGAGAGERCAVDTRGDYTVTVPQDDYTCKVLVSWNLVPADRVADIALIRNRDGFAMDVSSYAPADKGGPAVFVTSGSKFDVLSPGQGTMGDEYRYAFQTKASASSGTIPSTYASIYVREWRDSYAIEDWPTFGEHDAVNAPA
jgi:hypothetical protein